VPVKALATFWGPASPETLAPECLLSLVSAVQPAVAKVVFFLLTPVLMLLALLLIELAVVTISPLHKSRDGFADRLLATGMVVAFFFLPSVARTAFSLFACIQIDRAGQLPYTPQAVGWFFLHDTDQVCFVGWHRRLVLGLGIPLCVLVCMAPASILWLTLRNRKRLDDPDFRAALPLPGAVLPSQVLLLGGCRVPTDHWSGGRQCLLLHFGAILSGPGYECRDRGNRAAAVGGSAPGTPGCNDGRLEPAWPACSSPATLP